MTEIHEDIRAKAEYLAAILAHGSPLANTIAEALMAERERSEIVRAQAYQVIGFLLHELNIFESDEGQRALDYFSGEDCDEDFLPWPRDKVEKP